MSVPGAHRQARTGLDGYVVLDGHDRLVAALPEETARTTAWPLRWHGGTGPAAGFDPDLT